MKSRTKFAFLTGWALLMSCVVSQAQQATTTDNPQDMLAAQIRLQGFACDQALRATRDAKLSKPDHDVWVLRCSNATYRVSRAPDMAAKVEQLP
jgi:hypothetical protein